MSEFNKDFTILWDTKVKDQIVKCTPEYTNLRKMDELPEDEARTLYNEIKANGYHDIYGQYIIGNLIWAVEHALADDRKDLKFLSTFYQVYGTLNDSKYWENVFGTDIACEEAVELQKLRDYINKLAEMI